VRTSTRPRKGFAEKVNMSLCIGIPEKFLSKTFWQNLSFSTKAIVCHPIHRDANAHPPIPEKMSRCIIGILK
jgi:hypothetical protein